MEVKVCKRCNEQFVGRPNRLYCSPRCQHRQENRRKYWDLWTANADKFEALADAAENKDRSKQLKDHAERLRKWLGNRP
jgi:hypothetical protein